MNNTIINPATGRAVNRYGKTGQQVLKNRRTQRGGSKTRSARRNSRRKSQRRKSRSKIGGGSNQTGNSWIAAVAKARKQLGIKGFQAVRKGTPLYKKAKQIQRGGWRPWGNKEAAAAAEEEAVAACAVAERDHLACRARCGSVGEDPTCHEDCLLPWYGNECCARVGPTRPASC